MKKPDYRYEDLGPEYFGELCGGQVLSCEQGWLHDEHQSSPIMTRWRVTYRKDGGRHTASFVAKKFSPGHEGEIPIYCWLQENTTVNMPALIDFRNAPEDDNCWMLTENCYNYKDVEYYYLNRLFFSTSEWPPATEPTDPPEAFLRPLADLHGKTLGIDWGGLRDCPIPFHQPDASFDLPEWVCANRAVIHGSMNFQEVGFRKHPEFPPMWCLFDWERAQIGPIYLDLAQVHYGMSKAITDEGLSWYLREVHRLSGVRLEGQRVRKGIDIGRTMLGL
ncbi:hypothetical protein LCGC14_1542250 [marine sediment metagenome]|uniref:Aminoglycoside phosphotransferase domain-containing protein n=1 Tax=marine sediment metagenome TaxID=412755 RepID=A0A0F9ISS4_9ZZZZ